MSSLPTSSHSDSSSLRPRASVRAALLRTRPSAVLASARPGPDVEPALLVTRYADGASLTALAALALCDGIAFSGRPLDVVGNDCVAELPSGPVSVRPGARNSEIVERRSASQIHGASPTQPSCA